ncbi:DUF4244 domain-containing protein [Sciscionella marina]|uniref:DUF4244 domain-containing protein n=1 Tax=Sciscionella marina TaxID=508770 RepID=UPI000375BF0A
MSAPSLPTGTSADRLAEVIPIRSGIELTGAPPGRFVAWWRRFRRWLALRIAGGEPESDEAEPRFDDAGMSTAEYAIGTIAAAAFAAVLYTIVTGDSVLSALTSLVQRALSVSL